MTLSRTYEFLRKFGLASLLKRLKPVKMAFLTTKNFPNFPKFPNIFPGNPSSKKGAISREIPSSGNSQPNSTSRHTFVNMLVCLAKVLVNRI